MGKTLDFQSRITGSKPVSPSFYSIYTRFIVLLNDYTNITTAQQAREAARKQLGKNRRYRTSYLKGLYLDFDLRDSDYVVFQDPRHHNIGPCWIWLWCTSSAGYGLVRHLSKFMLVTRLVNLTPGDLITRHKCRNTECIASDHLESGTSQENALDKIRDGTAVAARGHNVNGSKLTESKVIDIYRRVHNGAKPIDLAHEFGVSLNSIYHIRKGKKWSWLTSTIVI